VMAVAVSAARGLVAVALSATAALTRGLIAVAESAQAARGDVAVDRVAARGDMPVPTGTACLGDTAVAESASATRGEVAMETGAPRGDMAVPVVAAARGETLVEMVIVGRGDSAVPTLTPRTPRGVVAAHASTVSGAPVAVDASARCTCGDMGAVAAAARAKRARPGNPRGETSVAASTACGRDGRREDARRSFAPPNCQSLGSEADARRRAVAAAASLLARGQNAAARLPAPVLEGQLAEPGDLLLVGLRAREVAIQRRGTRSRARGCAPAEQWSAGAAVPQGAHGSPPAPR
jgi:hypothetical protein